MCDESLDFWDFLNDKLEPEKSREYKCNNEKTAESEFWDCIEPLPSSKQSEPEPKLVDQVGKDDLCNPNNKRESGSSRLHDEYNVQYRVPGGQKETSDVCMKPPVKADDEFWDFLKCNAIAEELQEVFETPQETPLGKYNISESFYSATNELPYETPDSMRVSFPRSLVFENGNLDSCDIHRRNSTIPITKRTDINTDIKKCTCETDFPKSPNRVDHNRPSINHSKSPRNEKSTKISDDEFWDFLNSDSPVAGLSEVLQELPTYLSSVFSSTLKDSEDSHAHTLHEESTSTANLNLSYTARYSGENDETSSRDVNILSHSSNKNEQENNSRKINEKKLEIQDQKSTIKKNSTSGRNIKTIKQLFQEKEFQNNVGRVGSRPNSNTIIHNDKISIEHQCGKKAKIKLPCISSEFSVSPYPDWLSERTQKTPQNSSSNENNPKSIEIITHKSIEETKLGDKEVGKSVKYCRSLIQSPLGCSQFNITHSVLDSNLTRTDNKTFIAPKMQYLVSQTQVPNIDPKTVTENQTVFYPITSSANSSVSSFEKSNNVNTSKNFYLLLPQNQNSHILVLVNNATESEKILSGKNNSTSLLASSLNNNSSQNLHNNEISLENPNGLNQVNNFPKKTGISNNNDYNYEVAHVRKPVTLSQNFIQSNIINLSNGRTQSTNLQSFESLKAEKSLTNISNKNTSLLSNHGLTASSIPASTISTKDIQSQKLFRNIKPIQNHLHTKPICSTVKQPILKPIKSISLGKDKNAIQQTSVPLKMGSIAQGQQLCDQQGNVTNYLLFSNSSSLQSNISTYDTIESQCDKINIDKEGLKLNSNSSELSHNPISTTSVVTMVSNSIKIRDPPHVRTCNTSTVDADSHLPNTNAEDQDSNKLYSLKHNIMSVADTVLLSTNASISNSNDLKTSTHVPISCSNTLANNYVQVKVAPSQQKSATNFPGLLPPPISMVPVCVVPNTQPTTISTTAAKVLVLKSFGQQNILPQSGLPKRFTATQKITNVKKSGIKMKKPGRKTVRELIEERQQNMSSKLGNTSRKELRVLRPVQKIASATCSTCLPTTGVRNSLSYEVQRSDFNKRPNILMLPSARKTLKKNIIRDETNISAHKGLIGSSDIEISQQGKPNFRPRHYDMSELQIGYFHVDDDMDSCGRFRSKFKVIFSKRQFLYEFPVCQSNQVDLKSSKIWERMVRIIVPFHIITAMDLSDRTIHLSINSTPMTCLGRIHARSGIISTTTVYDKPVESCSSWDDAISSSYNHKIVLRKKQVQKLKYVLYQFDARFFALANSDKSQSRMHSNESLEGELSPSTLKKSLTKNKKACVRRLPQWDSSEHEDEPPDDDIDILKPQMCSCRISCRSVRCSCAKGAKSCSSVCICINCGNPLNVLESIGINIEFSLQDHCLFQNIYRIPNLLDFLLREIKLSCCNTFARVQDCIPGILLCPNIECNVQIEFSWCRVVVCYPERNPRNHCSFCGQCCFSNGQHCTTCNRCYVKESSNFPHCPTCREKPTAYDRQFHSNALGQNQFLKTNHSQSSSSKLSTKPEIVILNAYSIPKDETNFGSMESLPETVKRADSRDENFKDEKDEALVLEQMDFEVQEE